MLDRNLQQEGIDENEHRLSQQDGLIQVSVDFRMMIGGNKPGGLDKTRDEIFREVRADVKKFKG